MGSRLSAELQAFRDDYKAIGSKQRRQMAGTGTNRLARNKAFTEGQWVMTEIVHEVANINRRNPQAAKNLFPFRMLYPQTKTKAAIYNSSLATGESSELLNRCLTRRNFITVQVFSAAADVAVWLAAKPTDDMPPAARVIKANSKIKLKAEELGDLANTFLMIKNVSGINAVAYKVRITGMKKVKEAVAPEGVGKKMDVA